MADIAVKLNGVQVKSGQDLLNVFLSSNLTGSAQIPRSNILHGYSTFNYNVTLGVISQDEFNTRAYARNIDYIIFKSSGKPGNAQTLNKGKDLTAGQVNANDFIKTGQGQYDFYLQDLYIKSYIAGKGQVGDFTTELKLKILEPYGVDNLMKTMLAGLRSKGFYNFDNSCPFILKLDFVGQPDMATDPSPIPWSTRYYPIAIKNITANLTPLGTEYTIDAIPFQEAARHDDKNKIPFDMVLYGDTVGDIMKTLEKELNRYATQIESKTKGIGIKAHRYAIKFAKYGANGKLVTSGETQLSKSKMSTAFVQAGKLEFVKEDYDGSDPKKEKTGRDRMVFQVSGKNGVDKIINSLCRDSEFLVAQVKSGFQNQIDEKGNFPFWRVIPTVEIDSYDITSKRNVFKITYNIVETLIHKSKLAQYLDKASVQDFEGNLARVYEWQFTGNNLDVLSFNLDFNLMWARFLNPSYGSNPRTPGVNAQAATTTEKFHAPSFSVAKNAPTTETAPTLSVNHNLDKNNATDTRSSNETDPAFYLAKEAYDFINFPYDKVMMEMEILGDPMWLGTQFIDQGVTLSSDSTNMFTSDGAFAFRTVQPWIKVLAYAPTDFDAEGNLVSGNNGAKTSTAWGFVNPSDPNLFIDPNKSLSEWSAYYQIYSVEHFFTNGQFKQKLKGFRKYTDTPSTDASVNKSTSTKSSKG